jgi:uncharacterized protein
VTAPRPALVSHVVPGGAAWSLLVRRGRQVRFTALGDRANVSLLVLAAADPVDRMNVPDTLKAQMSACLRPPMVLMSDRGTGLASVTGSSLDWHDALCGHSTDAHLAKHGPSSYAADGNEWRRSARTGLLGELRKHGRDETALHASVNLFSKVAVGDDPLARLTFSPDHASAGDWLTLRAELDLLLVLSTAPHPLDPAWAPADVRVDVAETAPRGEDDPSARFRDESARALAAADAVFA